jgi:hypothetical protein
MVLVRQHDMFQPVSLQVLVRVKAEMAGGTLVYSIFYITISNLNFDTHFAAVDAKFNSPQMLPALCSTGTIC